MEQAQEQQTAQPEVPVVEHRYQRGDKIKHIESGNEYFIQLTPAEHIRVEASGELAYAYALVGQPVGAESPLWFRGQAEVEDTARFEHTPRQPDPREDPEFIEREKADWQVFAKAFQEEVARLIAEEPPLEKGFDHDALALKLSQGLVEFASKNYGETHEIVIMDPWFIDHAGKGGIPVGVADHVNGYQHDISTMFDIPLDVPEGPTFEEVEDVLDHVMTEFEHNLTVKAVRPTDGQAGREDAFDFYALSGFTTQGFGGRPPQRGLLLQFQDGPIKEVGHTGITIEALLAVCAHRLIKMNTGALECDENAEAIGSIHNAITYLKGRVKRRLEEGTLGTKAD